MLATIAHAIELPNVFSQSFVSGASFAKVPRE